MSSVSSSSNSSSACSSTSAIETPPSIRPSYNFQTEAAKTHSIALRTHKVQKTKESLQNKFVPEKLGVAQSANLSGRSVTLSLPADIQKLIKQGNDKAALNKLTKIDNPSAEVLYQLGRYYEWGTFKKGKIDIKNMSFEKAYQSYLSAAKAGHSKAIEKMQYWGFVEGGASYADKGTKVDEHIIGIDAAGLNQIIMDVSPYLSEGVAMAEGKDNGIVFIVLSNILPASPKRIYEISLKHRFAVVLDTGFMIGDKKFTDYQRSKDFFAECSRAKEVETYNPLDKAEAECCRLFSAVKGFCGFNAKCVADMFLEGKLGKDGKAINISQEEQNQVEPCVNYDSAFIWLQMALRLGHDQAVRDVFGLLRINMVSPQLYPPQDRGLEFFNNLDQKNFAFHIARFMIDHFYHTENLPEFEKSIKNFPIETRFFLTEFEAYEELILMTVKYYLDRKQYDQDFVDKAERIIDWVETYGKNLEHLLPRVNTAKANLYRYCFILKGRQQDLKKALRCVEIDIENQPTSFSPYLQYGDLLHSVLEFPQNFSAKERKDCLLLYIEKLNIVLALTPESNFRFYRDMKKQMYLQIGDAYKDLFELYSQSPQDKNEFYEKAAYYFNQAADLGALNAHDFLFELHSAWFRSIDPTLVNSENSTPLKQKFELLMDLNETQQDMSIRARQSFDVAMLYKSFGEILLTRTEAARHAFRVAQFSQNLYVKALFLEYTQGMSMAERQAFGISAAEISSWLQECADHGYSFALVEVAHQKLSAAKSLDSSTDAKQLRQEAIEYYEQAVQQNTSNLEARKALGFFALKGQYRPLKKDQVNYAQAIELLKPVAEMGDSQANLILGILCEQEILKEEAKIYFNRVQNFTTEAYHKAKAFLGFEAEVFEYKPFEKVATLQTSVELTQTASAPERILNLEEELEVAQDFYAKRLDSDDLATLFSLTLSKAIKGEYLMKVLEKLEWDCSGDNNKFKFKAPNGQVFGTHSKHDKDLGQGVVDIECVRKIRNYLISLALEKV